MTPEEKLAKLGLVLPTVPTPIANYVPFKRDGNTIYLSGQGPRKPDGGMFTGKVGRDVTVDEAYQHARVSACSCSPPPSSPPAISARSSS